jgi:hypothetical protein
VCENIFYQQIQLLVFQQELKFFHTPKLSKTAQSLLVKTLVAGCGPRSLDCPVVLVRLRGDATKGGCKLSMSIYVHNSPHMPTRTDFPQKFTARVA